VLTDAEKQALADLKAEIKRIREEMRDAWAQIRIDYQVTRLTSYLGLSESQAQAIKDILLAQHKTLQELREQYAGDPEGFRDAVKALLQQTDEAILALLDDEQDVKWEALKTLRLDWRRGHGHGMRG
jgi:hypothetical protein